MVSDAISCGPRRASKLVTSWPIYYVSADNYFCVLAAAWCYYIQPEAAVWSIWVITQCSCHIEKWYDFILYYRWMGMISKQAEMVSFLMNHHFHRRKTAVLQDHIDTVSEQSVGHLYICLPWIIFLFCHLIINKVRELYKNSWRI